MADCTCGYTVLVVPRVDLVTGQHGAGPGEGDFHVCPGCGEVLICAGGRWRPADMDEIFAAAPEVRITLARMSEAIRRAQALHARRGAGGMVN